jgi:hypothetical protein
VLFLATVTSSFLSFKLTQVRRLSIISFFSFSDLSLNFLFINSSASFFFSLSPNFFPLFSVSNSSFTLSISFLNSS